jgi:hypothetical protein
MFFMTVLGSRNVMSISPKSRPLFDCAALLISMLACCGGAARASEYEIEYRATLNEGGPPLASFQDSAPFAAGTPLTITGNFDSSTADQWNVGAYFYTAPSATFLIGSSTYEAEDPLEILLSDPSWQSVGGPFPYSAGFVVSGQSGLGSINSLFSASTNAFDAANPLPTTFNEYELNFDFTEGPLTLSVEEAPGGGQLVVYNASVSGVTATIFAVPEISTWVMMAFGFAGLGLAGRLREWRTESRAATA